MLRSSVIMLCLLCAGINVTVARDIKKDIAVPGQSVSQQSASKPAIENTNATAQGRQLSNRSFPGKDSGLFPLVLLMGTVGLLIVILWGYDRLKNGVAQDT